MPALSRRLRSWNFGLDTANLALRDLLKVTYMGHSASRLDHPNIEVLGPTYHSCNGFWATWDLIPPYVGIWEPEGWTPSNQQSMDPKDYTADIPLQTAQQSNKFTSPTEKDVGLRDVTWD